LLGQKSVGILTTTDINKAVAAFPGLEGIIAITGNTFNFSSLAGLVSLQPFSFVVCIAK